MNPTRATAARPRPVLRFISAAAALLVVAGGACAQAAAVTAADRTFARTIAAGVRSQPDYGAQQASVQQATQLIQAGQFHEAELLLRGLVRQYPKDASVRSTLGVALAQQGMLAAAVEEYRASLAFDPHQPQVDMLLGMSRSVALSRGCHSCRRVCSSCLEAAK